MCRVEPHARCVVPHWRCPGNDDSGPRTAWSGRSLQGCVAPLLGLVRGWRSRAVRFCRPYCLSTSARPFINSRSYVWTLSGYRAEGYRRVGHSLGQYFLFYVAVLLTNASSLSIDTLALGLSKKIIYHEISTINIKRLHSAWFHRDNFNARYCAAICIQANAGNHAIGPSGTAHRFVGPYTGRDGCAAPCECQG